jgi:chorismate synthase
MAMDGFTVNFEALEQCRTEVSGQAGPMAAAADGLPAGVGAGSFGDLDGAGKLADAVNAFSEAVGVEVGKASERLTQVGGAVEAVIDSVRATEQNNVRCLAPA